MAASFDKSFVFPPNVDRLINITGANTKICIVTIFGKSRLNPFVSKAGCLNTVVDRDVFQGYEGYLKEQIEQGQIECFYDTDSHVVYLNLVSFNDINLLARECERLTQCGNMEEFYSTWQTEDFNHAKNLAYLFNISHILLLYHPGSCFDLSYLRLFHQLDSIRMKLHPHITDVLSSVPGVSNDWASFGRMCTPRMLFVFETSSIDIQTDESDGISGKSTKKFSPIKKLQMANEDSIFRILRKTRAITNISNNSLFSVPLNQPYVYIQARKNEIMDPLEFLLSHIRGKCYPNKEDHCHPSVSTMATQGQTKPKPYSASRRVRTNPPVSEPLPLSCSSWKSTAIKNMANTQQTAPSMRQPSPTPFISNPPSTTYPSLSTIPSSSGFCGQEQCLKEFLWQHIEMVFAKSVNDNMGRHGIEPMFELPTLETWLWSSHHLHQFFFPPDANPDHVISHLTNLKNSLDISMRFSESRCLKWMSSAENTYQQDLPPFYVTSYHQSRLAKAKRVFSQYARGPAFHKYMCELEMWCDAYWKAGRQQCEAVSLSGNLCTLQRHDLPNDKRKRPEESGLPTVEHCSGLKTRSACNCGRQQAEKDDPYSHKYANHMFYQLMEKSCCGNLEHIVLPVFEPSTMDPCPNTQPSSSPVPGSSRPQQVSHHHHHNHPHDGTETDKTEVSSTLSDMSWLSLDQGASASVEPPAKLSQNCHSTDEREHESQATGDEDALVIKTEQLVLDDKEKTKAAHTPPLRQISTTEYLSGMIHTKSPSGLLPKFSSFSLIRLGPASHYSHNIGMDLPGFLPGSSFLLPWDITVKHESRDKWPSVAETFGGPKRRQQRKLSKVSIESSETQTTIRVYLGMEYECPRGHRFFCSGPDKIIKVSANSTVKDNAGRLVQMDMPLYTLCHCKQPKGCMAQMMRLFVVTPRDSPNCPSIRVQANPIIQPNPPPCPQFHPGLESALELPPDGLWVLRLPHVYQDDNCVYLIPSEQQGLHNCHLIKGTFSHVII